MPLTPSNTQKKSENENQQPKVQVTLFGFMPKIIHHFDHVHIINLEDNVLTMMTIYADAETMAMFAVASLLQELDLVDELTVEITEEYADENTDEDTDEDTDEYSEEFTDEYTQDYSEENNEDTADENKDPDSDLEAKAEDNPEEEEEARSSCSI